MALALGLSACGSADSGSASADGKKELKVAALFSGSATDADYNSLGLLALEAAEKEHGAETAHLRERSVPDAERVMKEYLADGYNVIWSHGSQYFEATSKLAKQNPDVTFIGEFDNKPKESVPNLWVLDRNFHVAFYPHRRPGGCHHQVRQDRLRRWSQPAVLYSEVHALNQALKDTGLGHGEPRLDR